MKKPTTLDLLLWLACLLLAAGARRYSVSGAAPVSSMALMHSLPISRIIILPPVLLVGGLWGIASEWKRG